MVQRSGVMLHGAFEKRCEYIHVLLVCSLQIGMPEFTEITHESFDKFVGAAIDFPFQSSIFGRRGMGAPIS